MSSVCIRVVRYCSRWSGDILTTQYKQISENFSLKICHMMHSDHSCLWLSECTFLSLWGPLGIHLMSNRPSVPKIQITSMKSPQDHCQPIKQYIFCKLISHQWWHTLSTDTQSMTMTKTMTMTNDNDKQTHKNKYKYKDKRCSKKNVLIYTAALIPCIDV